MQASLSRSVIGSASSPGGGSKQIAESSHLPLELQQAAAAHRYSSSGRVNQ